jgi:hypothetical protein
MATMPRIQLGAACAAAFGLALSCAGHAGAEDAGARKALSDGQMDAVAAGSVARAKGSGEARGDASDGATNVVSYVRADHVATAGGQVSASASAHAGTLAAASSTLSLTVSF